MCCFKSTSCHQQLECGRLPRHVPVTEIMLQYAIGPVQLYFAIGTFRLSSLTSEAVTGRAHYQPSLILLNATANNNTTSTSKLSKITTRQLGTNKTIWLGADTDTFVRSRTIPSCAYLDICAERLLPPDRMRRHSAGHDRLVVFYSFRSAPLTSYKV